MHIGGEIMDAFELKQRQVSSTSNGDNNFSNISNHSNNNNNHNENNYVNNLIAEITGPSPVSSPINGNTQNYEKHFTIISNDMIDNNNNNDDVASNGGGGGLYMEGGMDFVISADDNDDDTPAVTVSIPPTCDPSSIYYNILNSSNSEQESENMHNIQPSQELRLQNNNNNNNNQQQQLQIQQQHEYPISLGNGSTNSDAFFYSYTSWQNNTGNECITGEPSPGVSTSMEPLINGNLQQVGLLQHLNGNFDAINNNDNKINSTTIFPQTKQQMDDAVRSNLFISGLHSSVTDSELYKLFSVYGDIESAKVMLDIHTGKSRGIAFVKFADVNNAEKAAEVLNNSQFLGETIAVRIAKPHAAYRPGAPTNKTFVRNVPLSVKKSDLASYFARYGEVVDVSIHSDTAQRASSKKRNVAFITYTTKAAAATAAMETHTKTPFPDCDGVPLLAKVAEDSAHRIERLARRGGSRHGPNGSTTSNNNIINNTAAMTTMTMNNTSSNNGNNNSTTTPIMTNNSNNNNNGMASANNSVTSSIHSGIPHNLNNNNINNNNMHHHHNTLHAPPYSFAPPAFYPAPYFPMPAAATPAPFYFVSSDATSMFNPPPFPTAVTNNNNNNNNNELRSTNTPTSLNASPTTQQQSVMMMYAQSHTNNNNNNNNNIIQPPPTVMYYLPNGQVALAAAPQLGG